MFYNFVFKFRPRGSQTFCNLGLHADKRQCIYRSVRAKGIHFPSSIASKAKKSGGIFLNFVFLVPLFQLLVWPNLKPKGEICQFSASRGTTLQITNKIIRDFHVSIKALCWVSCPAIPCRFIFAIISKSLWRPCRAKPLANFGFPAVNVEFGKKWRSRFATAGRTGESAFAKVGDLSKN